MNNEKTLMNLPENKSVVIAFILKGVRNYFHVNQSGQIAIFTL